MTRAGSLLAAATSGVRNVIFGFVGTAVTFCRLSSTIRQNAPCAVENWIDESKVFLFFRCGCLYPLRLREFVLPN